MKKTHRVSREVKEQILARIKNEGIPIKQAAEEHGITDSAIYKWLGAGAEGAPTYGSYARLRRENEGLKQLVGEITLKLSEAQKKR